MSALPVASVAATLDSPPLTWRAIAELFTRPQPVTIPMVTLFAIIPIYLYIGAVVSHGSLHAPELPLDRALPLLPAWSLIYWSLFLAALLPVFVVHQHELVRRVIWAYLFIWLVAYAFFLIYPTAAPKRASPTDADFFNWVLRSIYASDVKYNCFPSLHVAQCFLASLTCYRVHRGLGAVTGVWASLVALSTLFTKQHYVLDVIAGTLLAYVAYVLFLRNYPRDATPRFERRCAPLLALGALGLYGVIVMIMWVVYYFNLAKF